MRIYKEYTVIFVCFATCAAHLKAALGYFTLLNPLEAPRFGGLWEGAVRRTKHHLKGGIGEVSLPFDEISTLLVQIETLSRFPASTASI